MKTNGLKKRALAPLLAVALLMLTACGGELDKPVGKVDTKEIPMSEYLYYVNYYISNLESNLQAKFEDFYSVAATDADAYLGQIRSSAFEQCVRGRLVDRLFADAGLKFEGDLQTQFEGVIANYLTQFQSDKALKDAVKAQGLTYAQFEELTRTSIKEDALLAYYAGPGTADEVNERTARDYYERNYTRVKHILIKTVDDSNQPLSDTDIAEAKEQYEQLMQRAQSGEDFDALVAEYSQDPGSASQPDGYIFTIDESFMQEFKDEAFRLAVDEIGSCETSYGYHIMRRYDLFENPEFFSSRSASIQELLKSQVLSTKISILRETITVDTDQTKIDALTLEEIRRLSPQAS